METTATASHRARCTRQRVISAKFFFIDEIAPLPNVSSARRFRRFGSPAHCKQRRVKYKTLSGLRVFASGVLAGPSLKTRPCTTEARSHREKQEQKIMGSSFSFGDTGFIRQMRARKILLKIFLVFRDLHRPMKPTLPKKNNEPVIFYFCSSPSLRVMQRSCFLTRSPNFI